MKASFENLEILPLRSLWSFLWEACEVSFEKRGKLYETWESTIEKLWYIPSRSLESCPPQGKKVSFVVLGKLPSKSLWSFFKKFGKSSSWSSWKDACKVVKFHSKSYENLLTESVPKERKPCYENFRASYKMREMLLYKCLRSFVPVSWKASS